MPVLIENRQQKVKVNTDKLKKVAQEILSQAEVDPHLELSVALVDKETIRRLNSRYRAIDETTDVLSFPMDTGQNESFSPPERLLGDVLICPEIASNQAKELKHSLHDELAILLRHGILSLLGQKRKRR